MNLDEQRHAAKQACPDALCLHRVGDFYELFDDDAASAAKLLGLTLTQREPKGTQNPTRMCGFPYHRLEAYIAKLIRCGQRVAICEPTAK